MKIKYWLLIIILLFSASFIWWSGFLLTEEPIYIALSGPMSGTSELNGKAMVQGVQMYLDQINQQGGRPIELLQFDDQNQPDLAKQTALSIAKQSQAVAVIGHYTSSASIAAAPIYQQYGIPAISGSATADKLTQGNDWYFRTIFNNSDQGSLLANYVRKILKYHVVDILFDEDVYGTTLAQSFVQTAEFIGLTVRYQWSINPADTSGFDNTLSKMIDSLQSSTHKKSMIFFATHSTEAVKAIIALRDAKISKQIKFIGADALSSSRFMKKMSRNPRELLQPGYYSDGIYVAAPLLINEKKMQNFRHEFIHKYQEEPTMTAALYYDAAQVMVQAITQLKASAQTLEENRRQVKHTLGQLSRLEDAVAGITGNLFFDKNGDIIQSIPIGFYEKGHPITAAYQFQLLNAIQDQDTLLQNVLDNKIIQVNGKFMNRTQVIYTGIDFNEINELDFAQSLYSADFFLWFRFKGDFDDANIEFLNVLDLSYSLEKPLVQQTFVAGKMLSNPKMLLDIKEQLLPTKIIANMSEQFDDKVKVKAYRIKTTFKADFDFHNYPMDVQILPIYFRHKILPKDALIYVVDTQGMQLKQFDPKHIEASTRTFFKLGDWGVNKILFFQSLYQNDSTLGMPTLFDNQQRIEFSQFNVLITIKRHVFNFIIKTLLPIMFLLALGYLAFFIASFGQKLSIGVNLILASSLFHLQLSSNLSNVGYIILMEYFFYLIYLLAIFIIAVAIFYHFTEDRVEDENVIALRKRIDLLGQIFYPVILLTGVIIIAIIGSSA